MSHRGRLAATAVLVLAGAVPATGQALRINGSTTVNPVVVEAAEILRRERGWEIQVDTLGGSSGGIAAVGDGRVEIGMSSRPLDDRDRAKFPGADLRSVAIGYDAVALVVSKDVWEGGVHALSRDDMRAIYEGRVRAWADLGGPDRRIAFFNKEPGRGTWEVFARWLYGSSDEAPLVSFPEVGANEEARAKVASTRGALSQLSASWADGQTVFALAVRAVGDGGETIAPTARNIAEGRYPMSRPLLLVTRGEPAGRIREFVDFVVGPRGQELLGHHGYLALGEVRGVTGGD